MGLSFKLKSFLWFLNSTTKPPQEGINAAAYRAESAKSSIMAKKMLQGNPASMEEVVDKAIPGRGGEIPIRIYKPLASNNLPVICYFHGGGFVISDIETHDTVCRKLAVENKALVVSVDYRLAPEHKFPAAVHDTYDATLWVHKNAKEFGGNPDKLVVMGDSAGGNLAAVTTLIAKEEQSMKIAGQVLIYPTVDGKMSSASIKQFAHGYLLSEQHMKWFLDQYKRDDNDILDPHLSPILAKDLNNLPPALVITAGYDPLKDEGKAYADRMAEAGNDVVYQDYPNLIHGFIQLGKLSGDVQDAYNLISEEVKRMIAPA